MTAPTGTPNLRIDFSAHAKIEVTIDIVAYYTKMPEREQAAYRTWTDSDFWETDREGNPVLWDKPLAYLSADLNETAEVNAGYPRGCTVDMSELEPWDTPHVRGGKWWTEDHYRQILAAVPWLAEQATRDEMTDEERAEHEDRQPGPLDVPLFTEEG